MTSPTATIVVGVLGLVGVLLSAWANIRIKQTDRRAAEVIETAAAWLRTRLVEVMLHSLEAPDESL